MTPVIRVCQKCGTEIPADAPEGGCPGCLLQTALDAAGGQVVFGRYTLVKVLGRGGMGIVWLARDEELDRDVALKFLPDLMIQDRALLDQLKHETKRCLELTHPHIVRIHDFVHDERSGCISMEYVDGETLSILRAEKEQKVFEPHELAGWIAQLCDALHYAHNHAQVIHRDLKPANLMVNKRGDLKVADFGIARSLADSASRLTAEHGRSGTLVYMSPQQLSGERGTHLDDIYSLGASMYELLTSKPPFYSGNVDRQICERVAPSMTERRKELDIEPALVAPVWEDTVAACLAKDASRRPQSTTEIAHRLQLPARSTRITTGPGKTSSKKTLIVCGIAALFALVLGGWYFGAFERHAKPIPPAVAIPEKSIAVLPFENRSEDKANAYFAEGIQDEILTRLSKVADLKVISRTSTQHYKSAPQNLPEIAKQLGVAHILEGSVQKSGDAVRVNVQLINASTDSHVWADTFDRKLTDIFSVESDVAKAITDQLRVRLSGREEQDIGARLTDNVEAYDTYLRGLAYIIRGITPGTILGAQKYLREAVHLDPKFATAWALLSYVDATSLLTYSLQPTAELVEETRHAAEMALTLQPNLGEALLAKGYYHYACLKDYDTAIHYFEEARQFLPNDSRIPRSLAIVTKRQGHWERSGSYFQEAERLDPRNGSLLAQHAYFYIQLRSFAAASDKLDQILDIRGNIDAVDTTALKAAVAQAEGDLPRASALLAPLRPGADRSSALETQVYQSILERRPARMIARLKEVLGKPDPELGYINGELRFWLGWAQETAGDHDAAQETWRQARDELQFFLRGQPKNLFLLADLALTNIGLGDKATALALSERAAAEVPLDKDAVTGPIPIEILARVTACTGDPDRSITALKKLLAIPSDGALGLGVPLTAALLRLDPMFDALRNDPRFEKLASHDKTK